MRSIFSLNLLTSMLVLLSFFYYYLYYALLTFTLKSIYKKKYVIK